MFGLHSNKKTLGTGMTCSRGREVVENWMRILELAFSFKGAFFEMQKECLISEVYVLSRWGREAGC